MYNSKIKLTKFGRIPEGGGLSVAIRLDGVEGPDGAERHGDHAESFQKDRSTRRSPDILLLANKENDRHQGEDRSWDEVG